MRCACAEEKKNSNPNVDLTLIEPYIAEHAADEGSLISILQKAQEIYGWLPAGLLAHIARRTGVKPSKVMGVVTFYTQFRTKPVGKHLVLLCQGTACHVNGSSGIEDALKDYLGVEEGGISENGLFTYNNVACLGCCSLSPAMMIGGGTYGGLTKDGAVKILSEIEREELSE